MQSQQNQKSNEEVEVAKDVKSDKKKAYVDISGVSSTFRGIYSILSFSILAFVTYILLIVLAVMIAPATVQFVVQTANLAPDNITPYSVSIWWIVPSVVFIVFEILFAVFIFKKIWMRFKNLVDWFCRVDRRIVEFSAARKAARKAKKDIVLPENTDANKKSKKKELDDED